MIRSLLVAWSILLLAQGEEYATDCSFPIFSTDLKCGDKLGDRRTFYEDYIEGCRQYHGPQKAKRCDATEADRIDMNNRQPQSMVVGSTGSRSVGKQECLAAVFSDTSVLFLPAELHQHGFHEDTCTEGGHGLTDSTLGNQQSQYEGRAMARGKYIRELLGIENVHGFR